MTTLALFQRGTGGRSLGQLGTIAVGFLAGVMMVIISPTFLFVKIPRHGSLTILYLANEHWRTGPERESVRDR